MSLRTIFTGLAIAIWASGAAAAGGITVLIGAPESDGLVQDLVRVEVGLEPASNDHVAVAEIEGRTTPLLWDDDDRRWVGTLDLAGLASGAKTLTVTATEPVLGSGQATRAVTLDRLPVLDVVSPVNFDVIDDSVTVDFLCQDDSATGCTDLWVLSTDDWDRCGGGEILATDTGAHLSVTLPFADLEHGDRFGLCFYGFDDAGQLSRVLRSLWVLQSDAFTEVEAVDGWIVDANEDALLILGDFIDTFPGRGEGVPLIYYDRGTGVSTVLVDDPNIGVNRDEAILTSTGAMFTAMQYPGPDNTRFEHLYDFNQGTLYDLGGLQAGPDGLWLPPQAAGDWATYSNLRGGPPDSRVYRRHLPTRVSEEVARPTSGDPTVAPDGSVAYTTYPDTEVFVYDGTTTQITDDPVIDSSLPVTDTAGLVYRRRREIAHNTYETATAYWENGVETLIRPFGPDTTSLGYLAEGDWVAYQRLGTGGQRQIWTRSPAGTLEQRTFLGIGSFLRDMTPRGDVISNSGVDLILDSILPVGQIDLGNVFDESFWIGGQLYRGLGRKLFRIDLSMAVAPPTSGAVAVTIQSPSDNGLIQQRVVLDVDIDSTFEVDTATADLDGRPAVLTYDLDLDTWTARIDMTGAPSGPKTLTVTATDIYGTTGMSTHTVTLDLLPELNVLQPLKFDVVDDPFTISILCEDDMPGGCTGISVKLSEEFDYCEPIQTLASAAGAALETQVAVPASFLSHRFPVCISATDAAGQVRTEMRYLWSNPNPDLEVVAEVDGWILDATPEKILFIRDYLPRLPYAAMGVPLVLYDRATGTETVIVDDPNVSVIRDEAFITNTGAIFRADVYPDPEVRHLFDFNAGELLDLGGLPLGSNSYWLLTEGGGDHAAYTLATHSPTSRELYQRHLPSRTDFLIASGDNPDQAADGTVVYTSHPNNEIWRYDDGTSTLINGDPSVRGGAPQSDGGAIAYALSRDLAPGQTERAIAYWKDGVEVLPVPFELDLFPRFFLAGDWLAFDRNNAGGGRELWIRDPDGVEEFVYTYGPNEYMSGVSSQGDVIYRSGNPGVVVDPVYRNGTIRIGSASDETFWVGGKLFRALGRKLLRLHFDVFSDGFESGDTSAWTVEVP